MMHHQSRKMAVAASRGCFFNLSSSSSVLRKYAQVSRTKGKVTRILHFSGCLFGQKLVHARPSSSGLFYSASLGPSSEWRYKDSYAHLSRTVSTSCSLSSRFRKKRPRRFGWSSRGASAGDESDLGAEELEEYLFSLKGRKHINEANVKEAVHDQGFEGTYVIGSSPSKRNSLRTDPSTRRVMAVTPNRRSYPTGDPRSAAQDEMLSNRSRFQDMMQVKNRDAHVHNARVGSHSWIQRNTEKPSVASQGTNIDEAELQTVSADLLEMDSTKYFDTRRKSHAVSWKKRSYQEAGKRSHIQTKAENDLMIPHGHDLLFGISPCLLALQNARRQMHQMYVTSALRNSERSEVKEILALAEERGLSVWTTNRRVLDKFSQYRPHQDPMNLGALIRSAYFLGVDKVIVSKKNCCSLTPVVSKASSGVTEIMPVYATAHIPSYLENKKMKGWSVVGASVRSSSSSGNVIPCHQFNHTDPIILVVGK